MLSKCPKVLYIGQSVKSIYGYQQVKKSKIQSAISLLKKAFKDLPEHLEQLDQMSVSMENLEFEAIPETVGFPLPKEIEGQGDVAIFSDGACRGNPGPGSWGIMGQNSKGEVLFEASGIDVPTTNNRMELLGAIESLKRIEDLYDLSSTNVFLYSDSKYVVDGINQWVPGWKKRGWKKADKKTPENVELWQELDNLTAKFPSLKYLWVKGHAGHPQNERCDFLANQALDEAGF